MRRRLSAQASTGVHAGSEGLAGSREAVAPAQHLLHAPQTTYHHKQYCCGGLQGLTHNLLEPDRESGETALCGCSPTADACEFTLSVSCERPGTSAHHDSQSAQPAHAASLACISCASSLHIDPRLGRILIWLIPQDLEACGRRGCLSFVRGPCFAPRGLLSDVQSGEVCSMPQRVMTA